MYINPKNSYEITMNSIYEAAEPSKNNRTYVCLLYTSDAADE